MTSAAIARAHTVRGTPPKARHHPKRRRTAQILVCAFRCKQRIQLHFKHQKRKETLQRVFGGVVYYYFTREEIIQYNTCCLSTTRHY